MPANIEAAMLEMFRAEVETHMAALSDGLLALEKRPDQSERFEGLMRAAHSIKGAAKIVGLPAAVQVAHAIEDCFVAARKGETRMTSGLVDVLLAGIDLLARAADVDATGATALGVGDPRIADIVARIASAARGEPSLNSAASFAEQASALRAPELLTGGWLAAQRDYSADTRIDLGETVELDAAALGYLALAAREPRPPQLERACEEIEHLLQSVGLGRLLNSSAAET